VGDGGLRDAIRADEVDLQDLFEIGCRDLVHSDARSHVLALQWDSVR
jgi:hypothetical protein